MNFTTTNHTEACGPWEDASATHGTGKRRTLARGAKVLAIAGLVAAVAIIGAGPVVADDHSTTVESFKTPTAAVKVFDDHSTGIFDQANGGSDDHSTIAPLTFG
ncbi:hypothetical protein BLA24_15230 [Streptomyces cinnamoneus]|uniref:Uncharacterized protein n=1 Tax=Streptomyces cinnamoneus TaxID=53446 RepID=A0A2G1XIP9_STRCJ|nr:hypothetical protein [Streptomyces cinnamoneus]PHQ51124.1 hypothetical protein BLA24_15230 [Streptomyces cinnamoneus]PPT13654.1 hypothetical protein CYQ11_12840 [Streptomyces cinnamoneus]